MSQERSDQEERSDQQGGAGVDAFSEIIRQEIDLLKSLSLGMEKAALAARRIEDPSALFALQQRNIAAFEACAAQAARHAETMFRAGVEQGFAALKTPDPAAEKEAGAGVEAPAPMSDTTADLNALRREALLESLRRVAINLERVS